MKGSRQHELAKAGLSITRSIIEITAGNSRLTELRSGRDVLAFFIPWQATREGTESVLDKSNDGCPHLIRKEIDDRSRSCVSDGRSRVRP
jgi:hypothetical protein